VGTLYFSRLIQSCLLNTDTKNPVKIIINDIGDNEEYWHPNTEPTDTQIITLPYEKHNKMLLKALDRSKINRKLLKIAFR